MFRFRGGSLVESAGMWTNTVRGLACFFGVAAILLGGVPKALGAPVRGEVFSHRQPDGTFVDVRIWGDEFYRVVESLDGYTLTPDPKTGAATYAQLSPDGNELVTTGVWAKVVLPAGLNLEGHLRINEASARAKVEAARARHAQQEAEDMGHHRAPAAPPDSGDVVGIMLLIDFSDDVATIPAGNVDDYCNQIGYTGYGNNGSVRDYFYEVSDSHLTYTNYVPTTYYRALQPKSYYTDSGVSFGTRARELLLEALTDLDASGFDFSQYDSNGDGLVDGVNVFYAGGIWNAWSEGLWPHSSTFTFNADGVATYKYQFTNLGTSLRLGTFCHENGHMLMYWPDLYDKVAPNSAGIGYYGLMCWQGPDTNPVHPCGYLKSVAGWSTTTFLGSIPKPGLVAPITGNTMFRHINPDNFDEFYIIENRQQTGRDAGIRDSGLAIWHIDTMGNNDWEQMSPTHHYKVTLVQADGNWDMENNRNGGDSTDLYGAPGAREFSPVTNPASSWWDGSVSSMKITAISASGPTMTFDYDILIYTDCNNNGINDAQDIFDGDSPDCQGNGIPDECELRDCAGDVACLDCNGNDVPDECDIVSSGDCDSDGVPDECAGGGVLVDTDFESGLPSGWTVVGPGSFSVTGDCAAAEPGCSGGANWAYLGSTSNCRYVEDESAELRLPTLTLGHGASELRFCSRVDVEPEWDFARILINSTVVWEQSVDTDVWLQEILDLTDYNGQTVDIVFQLYSDEFNAFDLGWQIDNVYLSSGTPDCDDDNVPDSCQADIDCNGNGTYDGCDIADLTSPDCNGNNNPDECDIDENSTAPGGPFYCTADCDPDCNNTGTPDACELTDNDCNSDLRPDECGVIIDCGTNRQSNASALFGEDCDCNAIADVCDIAACPAEDLTCQDCDGNGVPDACDLAECTPGDPVCSDCNTNGIPDGCDVGDGGGSSDENGNGIPDECDAVAPALPPAPHDARKNRYISIDPRTSGEAEVAIEVELVSMKRCSGDTRRACIVDGDCPGVCSSNNDLQCEDDGICGGAGPCLPTGPCIEHGNVGSVTRHVNTPVSNSCVPLGDCAGHWFADLEEVKANAVYRVWTEDIVHIADCAIVPVASYSLRSTMDGTFYSDPMVTGTCFKPNVHYGDCVGPVEDGAYTPPDGFANVSDVQAYLLAVQGGATAPHTTWVDLHGALIGTACTGGDCIVPQQILNVGDLQTIKFGFGGNTYTETPGQDDPADCP